MYRLVVAKDGPKLAQAKEQDADHRWGTTPGPGFLLMTGTSIEKFASWLSVQLNQPIIESTGLTGRYDLKLEWAEDDSQTPRCRHATRRGQMVHLQRSTISARFETGVDQRPGASPYHRPRGKGFR